MRAEEAGRDGIERLEAAWAARPDAIAAEIGLPADDPVRFGADRLWSAIRGAVDGLPWV